MRKFFAVLSSGLLLAAGPAGAEEETDMIRLQRDVGRLLSDYQRGLAPRTASLRRDGIALGFLREGMNRISSFQRDTTLEFARNKAAEARTYLERQGPLSDPAYRALARVDDILKPPVASEPAERTKAKLLAALEPFQTDLLQRAMVLTNEADMLRRYASMLSSMESQARGELPGVFRSFLDLSKIAIENEADAGR